MRGRVRDLDAKQRILDATIELLGAKGAGHVGIDEIAHAAEVGKQTIYRWWPSKQAVVIDALLNQSVRETPFRDTGDPRGDLRHHLRGVIRLFTSPTGALIREVVALSLSDPALSQDFIDRFWQPRRELSMAFVTQAIDRGELRADFDIEAALDTVYSPLWSRLLMGHGPLNYRLADDILDVVWPGVQPPGS